MKITQFNPVAKILTTLLFCVSCSSIYAEEYSCVQHMYNVGLATNAQLNCGFKHWNDAVTEYGASCLAEFQSPSQKKLLEGAVLDGVRDFDRQYRQAKDKKAICRAFQQDFSDFVK